ncbi:MAG: tetratricopeptide repeat protein [Bacteroidetes bacterium]|nr:tetratricopeptide repeat protein [Bacteroidota bacterium]
MKYRFVWVILLVSIFPASAQKVNVDSLKGVLERKNLTVQEELVTVSLLGKALRKSNAQEASAFLFKALSLSEELNDSLRQANAYQLLGNIMVDKGQYEQATEFYMKAITYFQQKQDTLGMIKVNQGLGQCFDLLKNYKNAVQYFQQALNIALPFGKKNIIAACYMNLGVACQESGEDDKALSHYEKCKFILDELNMKEGKFVLYNNMSVVLEKQKQHRDAMRYAHKAYNLIDSTTAKVNVANCTLNLGELYFKAGRNDSALFWLHRAVALAEKNKFQEQIINSHHWLAEVYSAMNHYQEAYASEKRYREVKDSVFDQRELWLVQQLHEGYQLGEKEKEIRTLKAEQEKLALDLKVKNLVTTLMIVVTASVILLGLVIMYYYRRKQRLAAMLDNQNKEIHRLNQVLEIKALRSQMDPHFVFNALNGLQHYLKINTPEASIEYLSKVARLIRLTLQNASRDWVKLNEEMEILKLYMQIEQYRFPGKFDFEFRLEPGVENEKVPFLVIQPYVENSVLHGLIPRTKPGGKVVVSATKKNDKLLVIVEDNGVGRSAASNHGDPMFTSMGSGLVKERLKKLSLQLGVLMEAVTEDLKDENGNASGTRSTLTFEVQSLLQTSFAA